MFKKTKQDVGIQSLIRTIEQIEPEWKLEKTVKLQDIDWLYLYFQKGSKQIKLIFRWRKGQWIFYDSLKEDMIIEEKRRINEAIKQIRRNVEKLIKEKDNRCYLIDKKRENLLKESMKTLEKCNFEEE